MFQRHGVQKRGQFIAVLAALATAASVPLASFGADSAALPTLRIVATSEPSSLEPCQSATGPIGFIERENILQGLTKRNPATGQLTPALATSWKQSSDTKWVFQLRNGVKFHDGTVMTADDVIASIARNFDYPALNCTVAGGFFFPIKLTAAVVGKDVEITTSAPDPILLLRLSFLPITPKNTPTNAITNKPIGTGPYKLVDWQQGVGIKLTRAEDYWGPKPAYKDVNYRFNSDAKVRGAMVRVDEVDIASDLDPSDANAPGAVKYDTYQHAILKLDNADGPTKDIRVREAIFLAIDVQGIIKAAFGGAAAPASQMVLKDVSGYNPNMKPPVYNPAKAKSLVAAAAAAGVDVKEPITLVARKGTYSGVDLEVQIIQEELNSVGLNAKVQLTEPTVFNSYSRFPFNRSQPGSTILVLKHGNQAGDGSFSYRIYATGVDVSYANDPKSTDMVNKAMVLTDKKREQAFQEIAAYAANQYWTMTVARLGAVVGVGQKVAYTPNGATIDFIELAQIKPRGR